jgi:hypothetical protein
VGQIGEHVKLVSQAYGEPVMKSGLMGHNAGENIAPAGLWSTAPYVPPRKSDRANRCSAKSDTCMGIKMKDSIYCVGHARSMAALPGDPNAAKKPKSEAEIA